MSLLNPAPTTQPISVVSLPLPSGAATSGDLTPKACKIADINLSGAIGAGDQTAIAAVSSKRIKVYAYQLFATASLALLWKSGAATTLGRVAGGRAALGDSLSVAPPHFLFGTAAGDALVLNLGIGAGVVLSGWIAYWDSDAT